MGYDDTVDFKVYNLEKHKNLNILKTKYFFFFKWKNSLSIKGYDT